MKQYSIFFFLIAFFPNLNSQELLNKEIDELTGNPIRLLNKNSINNTENLSFENLTYDCSSVFWTINNAGHIYQWNLFGNQVTGGSSVQYCNGVSLAFCGETDSLTFYSSNYPSTGILKYDDNLGWTTIPTSIPLLNNGGFHENQYFYYYNNSSIQDLYHFDGVNLSLIEHLPGPETFAIADIAVDSLGRAWVFTGATTSSIDTLRIYDENGFVTSYPINFDGSYCYGSFFINDQLYIGVGNSSMFYSNSLLPIIVNGTSATIGTPIPFQNYNYTDMASCNIQSSLNTDSNIYNNKNLLVFPNPTDNIINIYSKENILSISLFTLNGNFIKTFYNINNINISDFESNMYILKINSENNIYHRLIMKE